jgi:hypothetical protein
MCIILIISFVSWAGRNSQHEHVWAGGICICSTSSRKKTFLERDCNLFICDERHSHNALSPTSAFGAVTRRRNRQRQISDIAHRDTEYMWNAPIRSCYTLNNSNSSIQSYMMTPEEHVWDNHVASTTTIAVSSVTGAITRRTIPSWSFTLTSISRF